MCDLVCEWVHLKINQNQILSLITSVFVKLSRVWDKKYVHIWIPIVFHYRCRWFLMKYSQTKQAQCTISINCPTWCHSNHLIYSRGLNLYHIMSTMLVGFSMTSGNMFSLKRQILQWLLLTCMTLEVKLQHLDTIESNLKFGIGVDDKLLVN